MRRQRPDGLSLIAATLVWAALGAPAAAEQAGAAPDPVAEVIAGAEGGFTNPFESVEVQQLSQIGSDQVGLVGAENGGLAPDAWSGSERLLVEILMPVLPGQPGSPAAADLQRRLLLSRTKPPMGATGDGVSLFGVRLDRVLALGQVGAVEPLAQQVPGELSSPAVVGPRVDALFLQARDEEACALAATARGQVSDAEWIKRIAVCDALGGNVTGARLGVDLLRESGEVDAAFLVLMGRLVDKSKSDVTGLETPAAVHFVLLRHTGAALPGGAIARAGGGFAAALASLEALPHEQRILAAERAVQAGALPAGALRALWEAAPFTDKELAGEGPANGPLAAAMAFQRAKASAEPAQQAGHIAQILKDGRARGVMPAVARALKPDFAALAGLALPEDAVVELGLGEALAGEPATARRWLDALAAAGQGDTAKAGGLRGVLAVALGPDQGWSADALAARIAAAKGPAKDQAILEYNLMRALGAPANDKAYRASLAGPVSALGAVPNPAVLEGLIGASTGGRTAETLLFALGALGEDGVATAHPATLVSVLGALRRAGFEAEARTIAAEALAARLP